MRTRTDPYRLGGAAALGSAALLAAANDGAAQDLPDPEPYTEFLQEVVETPLVDYQAVLEHRHLLDGYIDELGRTDPADLEAASADEQLAFWLNAYNACMLQLVADHYPIEPGGVGLRQGARNLAAGRPDNSPWQIRGVFDGDHCTVAGEERSQDEIEHEIIRPLFQEPRIHFAVNCAAWDCPELREEAYVGERLDEQLDDQVEIFVSQERHFEIREGSPTVLRVNSVLDWFSEDFGGEEGIPGFFAPYVPPDEREALRGNVRVEFIHYDWTLNDVHTEPEDGGEPVR